MSYEIRDGFAYDLEKHCCAEAFYVMRKRSLLEKIVMYSIAIGFFGLLPLVEKKADRYCHADYSDIDWEEAGYFYTRAKADAFVAEQVFQPQIVPNNAGVT
jgi:hypothetical protein